MRGPLPERYSRDSQMSFWTFTHWGRVTHICVGKLIIFGWDNGLSPDRRQAIISTNAELLPIGPLPTYFSENLIKIQQFSLKKMHMKISSAKWCPFRLGLNVFIVIGVLSCTHSAIQADYTYYKTTIKEYMDIFYLCCISIKSSNDIGNAILKLSTNLHLNS